MQRLVACVMVSMMLVVGCGDDGEESGNGGASSSADGTTLLALLASVPDTADTRFAPVSYGSLDRLRGGETADSADADVALLTAISPNAAYLASMLSNAAVDPEFATMAGFDTRAVRASLEFGQIPDHGAVIAGSMDADAMAAALRTSPGGDALVVAEADGVTRFELGDDDTASLLDASAVRRSGEPLRMALADGRLVWTRSTELVDACLAASAGTAPSLADDAAYLGVATALDAADAHFALLATPRRGESWLLSGHGESFVDGVNVLTVALHYADPAAATAAEQAFRSHILDDSSAVTGERWADSLIVTETRVEGNTMVAVLSGAPSGFAYRTVMREEGLVQF
ncbi:MAG: hypothetical protein Q8M22_17290 [Actinomycetota bacterium]|nr:hypothetical protein [Actinomycetota bacterium]